MSKHSKEQYEVRQKQVANLMKYAIKTGRSAVVCTGKRHNIEITPKGEIRRQRADRVRMV